ncbi:MAG: ferrochelatase [Nitrospirota bacterium]
MTKTTNETIGVLLLNLGGPDSIRSVKPFLYNLFSDRLIIQLGLPFMQKPLAWLISALRSGKTKKAYSLIGGKSPILESTKEQAKALENVLNSSPAANDLLEGEAKENAFRVFVAMRYWHPLIEEVIPEICREGIKRVVAVGLYPHYSVTTTGSSLAKLREVAAGYPLEICPVESWHNHPLYIEALIDVIRQGLKFFEEETRAAAGEGNVNVLFSAHSLPLKIVKKGDPYLEQILVTIEDITRRIPLKWHLSFQSKSGPVEWLSPSTEEKLEELSRQGVKNVLVVPISFVSDHIETLFEIDILYKSYAERLGLTFKRVRALNTHPVFIEALKDIVLTRIRSGDR